MRALLLLLCCFSLLVLHAQENHVMDFSAKEAYLDFGGTDGLKPTEEITFGLWAYHKNWQAIDNLPTIMGNTQHVGFAISLIKEDLVGWISVDSTYKVVEYPTRFLTPGWHHLAVSFDGNMSMLLIDGKIRNQLRWETRRPIVQPDSSITFMIGAETRYNGKPHPGVFFDGKVDDAFIYSTSLDQAEIMSLMKGQVDATESSLLLWADFEQIEDSTFLEASSHQHRGVRRNGAKSIEISFPKKASVKVPAALKWGILLISLLAFALQFRNRKAQVFIVLQCAFGLLIVDYFLSHHDLSYPTLGIGFWNIHLAHLAINAAVGLLMLATRFKPSKGKLNYLPYVVLSISVSYFLLPIILHQWIMLLVMLTALVWMAVFIRMSGQRLLWIGFGGLAIAWISYLGDSVGLVYLESDSPFKTDLAFLITIIGFYPLTKLSTGPQIVLNSEAAEILSKKEAEVAKLMASGMTDAEIAAAMKLSPNTIKTYNKRIYGKLTLASRRDIVRFVTEES